MKAPAQEISGQVGPRGPKVRSDCWIGVAPRTTGGIEIDLESTVESYYGDSIRATLDECARKLGLTDALIQVADGGAYPFVMMARLEVAVRRALPSLGHDWVPPMDPVATYGTRRDRLRRSRLWC